MPTRSSASRLSITRKSRRRSRRRPAARYKATALPFNTLAFTADGDAFTVNVEGTPYRCTVADATCRKAEPGPRGGAGLGVGRRRQDDSPRLSPDGKWEALINNYNVAVRPAGTRAATRLSTDGSEGNYYDCASLAWSPDSTKIAAYRVRPGYRRLVHYVESSPEDQVQPKHSTLLYAKPGDVLDLEQPVLFDVAAKKQIAIDNALFPNPYDMSRSGVAQGQPRLHVRIQPARPPGVSRHRSRRARPAPRARSISEEPKTFFYYNRSARHAAGRQALSATTSPTARKSSGCRSATAGTISISTTARPAR